MVRRRGRGVNAPIVEILLWWCVARQGFSAGPRLADTGTVIDRIEGLRRAGLLLVLAVLLGAAVVPPAASALRTSAAPRILHWSGYDWIVKDSAGPVGPGPNHFSDSSRNVWVDPSGRLHLRIEKRNGRWWCGELWSTTALGYGTSVFQLDTAASSIDRNAVLGLFTWDDAAGEHHREIDVELSRWGARQGPNATFTVQPYQIAANGRSFTIPGTRSDTTQAFDWEPGNVDFWSLWGHRTPPVDSGVIRHWVSRSPDVPTPGNERIHINLWLFGGHPPSDGRSVTVVIDRFEFVPPA
jgi:hypothetical protein